MNEEPPQTDHEPAYELWADAWQEGRDEANIWATLFVAGIIPVGLIAVILNAFMDPWGTRFFFAIVLGAALFGAPLYAIWRWRQGDLPLRLPCGWRLQGEAKRWVIGLARKALPVAIFSAVIWLCMIVYIFALIGIAVWNRAMPMVSGWFGL